MADSVTFDAANIPNGISGLDGGSVPNGIPFKQKKTLQQRIIESRSIRARFPKKVPLIVERYKKEKSLPLLDRAKFLVPQEISMSQFILILRSRMVVSENQAIYLLVNNRSIVCMSSTVGNVYELDKDDDGFLYITYASQEMFGGGADPHSLSPHRSTLPLLLSPPPNSVTSMISSQ